MKVLIHNYIWTQIKGSPRPPHFCYLIYPAPFWHHSWFQNQTLTIEFSYNMLLLINNIKSHFRPSFFFFWWERGMGFMILRWLSWLEFGKVEKYIVSGYYLLPKIQVAGIVYNINKVYEINSFSGGEHCDWLIKESIIPVPTATNDEETATGIHRSRICCRRRCNGRIRATTGARFRFFFF